jgi:hypothetical protein
MADHALVLAGSVTSVGDDNKCRSPLSGRSRVGSLPRAKALGYSVLPFHGRRASRIVALRPYAILAPLLISEYFGATPTDDEPASALLLD